MEIEEKKIDGTNENSLRSIKAVWMDWKKENKKINKPCKYHAYGLKCLNHL